MKALRADHVRRKNGEELPHLSKKIGDDKMISLLFVLFFAWLILTIVFAIVGAIVKLSLKLVFGCPIIGAVVILLIVMAIL